MFLLKDLDVNLDMVAPFMSGQSFKILIIRISKFISYYSWFDSNKYALNTLQALISMDISNISYF